MSYDVEPNPRHSTANKGATICKKEGIDVILAVGGGSTIDCAKGVAAAAVTEDGDVWPLVSDGVWVTEALSVVVILTNAATGSEMDACACHVMEHELSAYYDITHGHGLAIVTPRWLSYILNDETAPAIYRLGVKVFGVAEGFDAMEGAKKAIEEVSDFCYKTLGLKSTLTDLGIDEEHFKDMAKHACGNGVIPGPKNLCADDVENIYKMCL